MNIHAIKRKTITFNKINVTQCAVVNTYGVKKFDKKVN